MPLSPGDKLGPYEITAAVNDSETEAAAPFTVILKRQAALRK